MAAGLRFNRENGYQETYAVFEKTLKSGVCIKFNRSLGDPFKHILIPASACQFKRLDIANAEELQKQKKEEIHQQSVCRIIQYTFGCRSLDIQQQWRRPA
jgi:hypothetical protein